MRGHAPHRPRRFARAPSAEARVSRRTYPAYWFGLERLILQEQSEPHYYLLPRRKAIPRKGKTVIHRSTTTAGKRVLDVTGNLKAVQKLLGTS